MATASQTCLRPSCRVIAGAIVAILAWQCADDGPLTKGEACSRLAEPFCRRALECVPLADEEERECRAAFRAACCEQDDSCGKTTVDDAAETTAEGAIARCSSAVATWSCSALAAGKVPPECEARKCDPGTAYCDGQTRRVCNSTGTAERTEDCERCTASSFGCSCVVDACEPRLCTPGARTCRNGALERCSEDGLEVAEVSECRDGQVCADGACRQRICRPDETRCEGDVLVACSSDGVSVPRSPSSRLRQRSLWSEIVRADWNGGAHGHQEGGGEAVLARSGRDGRSRRLASERHVVGRLRQIARLLERTAGAVGGPHRGG